MKIDNTQLTFSNKELVCFASDILLEVGRWPQFIEVNDGDQKIMFWRRQVVPAPDGDVGGYVYYSELGQKLTVFND